VPSDDGWLPSRGLVDHRREICLGIFQLNLSHGTLPMTIVVIYVPVVRAARLSLSDCHSRLSYNFRDLPLPVES
jgi:hypothetical protein